MKEQHNGTISLWKFIYCLMIIALHVGALDIFKTENIRFSGGSIGVEYFFIVSGFLLGKKALKKVKLNDLGIETRDYILRKLKTLIPMTLIVFIFSFIFFNSVNNYAMHDKVNFIWDILLLRNSGISYRTLIYVGWFTTVLVFSSLILYPLVLKYKNKFVYIIGPIIVMLIGSYVAYKWGSIAWDGEYYTKCFLRGFFEMTLGVCLVPLSKKINKTNLTKFGRIFLTFVEVIGFSSVLFVVNTENSHLKYDFVLILIFAICISLAFSEKCYTQKINSNKFIYFLEKLSFPMYLSQGLIIAFVTSFTSLTGKSYFGVLFLVIILNIAFSLLCLLILYLFKKYGKKVKKIFVNEGRFCEKC